MLSHHLEHTSHDLGTDRGKDAQKNAVPPKQRQSITEKNHDMIAKIRHSFISTKKGEIIQRISV